MCVCVCVWFMFLLGAIHAIPLLNALGPVSLVSQTLGLWFLHKEASKGRAGAPLGSHLCPWHPDQLVSAPGRLLTSRCPGLEPAGLEPAGAVPSPVLSLDSPPPLHSCNKFHFAVESLSAGAPVDPEPVMSWSRTSYLPLAGHPGGWGAERTVQRCHSDAGGAPLFVQGLPRKSGCRQCRDPRCVRGNAERYRIACPPPILVTPSPFSFCPGMPPLYCFPQDEKLRALFWSNNTLVINH